MAGTYHPECPNRIAHILHRLNSDKALVKCLIQEPRDDKESLSRALQAIQVVHDATYIKQVRARSLGGAPQLQPWDSDTFMSKTTWDCVLLAQSAWLDGIIHVLPDPPTSNTEPKFAFAITRPPGHHSEALSGQGFCIFNFAAAAAVYALQHNLAARVSILDFDVHYGNGVADIVQHHPNIRYASLHQGDIYPSPPRPDGLLPTAHSNIFTVNLPSRFRIEAYMDHLTSKVLPFLLAPEHKPELLIVCAGYDALASDELASGGLSIADYHTISSAVRASFRGPVLYGLEGGYNLEDMPLALEQSIRPYA